MAACEQGDVTTIVVGWGEANHGEDGVAMARELGLL